MEPEISAPSCNGGSAALRICPRGRNACQKDRWPVFRAARRKECSLLPHGLPAKSVHLGIPRKLQNLLPPRLCVARLHPCLAFREFRDGFGCCEPERFEPQWRSYSRFTLARCLRPRRAGPFARNSRKNREMISPSLHAIKSSVAIPRPSTE